MASRQITYISQSATLRRCAYDSRRHAGALLKVSCAVCGLFSATPTASRDLLCSDCRSVYYCSRRCAAADVDRRQRVHYCPSARAGRTAPAAADSLIELQSALQRCAWARVVLAICLSHFFRRGWTGTLVLTNPGAPLRLMVAAQGDAHPHAGIAEEYPLLCEMPLGTLACKFTCRSALFDQGTGGLGFEFAALEAAIDEWPRALMCGELLLDLGLGGPALAFNIRPTVPVSLASRPRPDGAVRVLVVGPPPATHRRVDGCYTKPRAVLVCSECLNPCQPAAFVCLRCRSEAVCSNLCAVRAGPCSAHAPCAHGSVDAVGPLMQRLGSLEWAFTLASLFLCEAERRGRLAVAEYDAARDVVSMRLARAPALPTKLAPSSAGHLAEGLVPVEMLVRQAGALRDVRIAMLAPLPEPGLVLRALAGGPPGSEEVAAAITGFGSDAISSLDFDFAMEVASLVCELPDAAAPPPKACARAHKSRRGRHPRRK